MIVRKIMYYVAISLIVGVAIIAAAAGSIYPPIYRAGNFLVCGNRLTIESQEYSYKPGQAGIEHKIYCEDPTTGSKKDVSVLAVLSAGLVYAVVVFIAVVILDFFLSRHRKKLAVLYVNEPKLEKSLIDDLTSEEAEEMLQKLKKIREANLITPEEFEAKSKKISENQ
jgi:hypothetical protein